MPPKARLRTARYRIVTATARPGRRHTCSLSTRWWTRYSSHPPSSITGRQHRSRRQHGLLMVMFYWLHQAEFARRQRLRSEKLASRSAHLAGTATLLVRFESASSRGPCRRSLERSAHRDLQPAQGQELRLLLAYPLKE